MRKIGIMGGTFDPIHTGHLLLAEWARSDAGLDEVWFVPTGQSYMKEGQNVLPGKERLHMVRLAVEGNECLRDNDLEIRRDGYTYSYETMEQLRSLYPEDSFYFIEGADCLFTMENWKYPERLFASCTILAAMRGDVEPKQMEAKRIELMKRFGGNILLLPFLQLSISSSEIRKRVREGQSIRYMVPDSVAAYIKEKGFYNESL